MPAGGAYQRAPPPARVTWRCSRVQSRGEGEEGRRGTANGGRGRGPGRCTRRSTCGAAAGRGAAGISIPGTLPRVVGQGRRGQSSPYLPRDLEVG